MRYVSAKASDVRLARGVGLVCLFLSLPIDGVARAQDPCPEPESSRTVQSVQVMTLYPVYSTESGWVNGDVKTTLPSGIPVQICERRKIGLPGASQLWLKIHWSEGDGWIYGEGTVQSVSSRTRGRFGPVTVLMAQVGAAPDPATPPPLPEGHRPALLLVGWGLLGVLVYNLFEQLAARWRTWKLRTVLLRSAVPVILAPGIFQAMLSHLDLAVTETSAWWALYLFGFREPFALRSLH